MAKHSIIILDLGSQTTNLIARRVRSLGVASVVMPHTTSAEEISALEPYGIILSGSPYSIANCDDYPKVDKRIFELSLPVLGICYGLYLVAEHLGGKIVEAEKKEYGSTNLTIKGNSALFSEIPSSIEVWMNHGSKVEKIAHTVSIDAITPSCEFAAFSLESKKLYAVQFHPEVEHTSYGSKILSNFVFKICQAKQNWKLDDWVKDKIAEVKSVMGNNKAICAVSGGVDSTVAATLCSQALGSNLHCVFVNTGLLRKDEVSEVERLFKPHNLKLITVNAERRFIDKLRGVTDPETKRKIIGNEYIRIFEEEARKLGKIDYLIQGTIYSDKIESNKASHLSSNIKSHHNVGGLPDKMDFKIYEPLDSLFKDEVRQVGKIMGLPQSLTGRHPFPGPGLAIQIVGEVTEEKINIVRQADAIVLEEVVAAGLYDKIGEIFTNFTGVTTTGVKGDERAYEWLIALRAVDPSDLMTSNWSRLPYDLLARISSRITNEVPHVNRVVYDITTKPPATIRWE